MDQTKNRPWLRSHGNSARVLVFDQNEAEETANNVKTELHKRPIPPKY